MEKESFVKIIDATVELIRISNDLDKLLNNSVEFAIPQIEEIVEALEIEFEDTERWIYWWLFQATDEKELEVEGWLPSLPTAGDLYDFLEWNNANS
jgi:hypothetical protein